MSDFSPTSITNVLLNGAGTATTDAAKPKPTVAELQAQIDRLTNEKNYFQRLLDEARKPEYQLRRVLTRILGEAKGIKDLDPDVDIQPMYDRLVELVEGDDNEDIWSPEREFDVTVKLLVTISGTVKARTAEDAQKIVEEDLPEVEITSENAVDGAYIWDTDVRDVDIS